MPPPGFGPPLASFGARLVGSLVDGLITMLFLVPAIVAFVAGPWDTDTCVVDGRFTTCDTPAGETVALGLFLGLLGLLCGLAYHVLPVASSGATPGRKLAGCRVVDLGTGRPPSKAKALGRYLFASFISGNACYLGHLWMLWDPANQTWHDKVCNTVVVRA